MDENGDILQVKCVDCDTVFPDVYKVKKNQKCDKCDSQKYTCEYCDSKFSSKALRKAHEKSNHVDGEGHLLQIDCKGSIDKIV